MKPELEGRLVEDSTTLADIIQISARGPGVVELVVSNEDGSLIGTIWMTDGRILDAESPTRMGIQAFHEVFSKGMTTDGAYFRRTRRATARPEGQDLGSVHALLLDATIHMDSVQAGVVYEDLKTLNLGPIESETVVFNTTLTAAMQAYTVRDLTQALSLFERCDSMRPGDRGIRHNMSLIRSKVALVQKGA